MGSLVTLIDYGVYKDFSVGGLVFPTHNDEYLAMTTQRYGRILKTFGENWVLKRAKHSVRAKVYYEGYLPMKIWQRAHASFLSV